MLHQPFRRTARGATALLAAMLIATSGGCVGPSLATSNFAALPEGSAVLLMPPDIKYYRVTASGITEPNADWTDDARLAFDRSFQSFQSQNALRVIRVDAVELSAGAVEYDRLHSAVGNTIVANHFGPTKLPAKNRAFDWSLGPGVQQLLAQQDERYALFVHYRDYQAGGGRVGVAVFAALLGSSVYMGHQAGFASLVDLSTGDVVWFNHLPLAQGDMRSPGGADRLVKQLFGSLISAE